MKEKIKILKKLWSIPRYKAIIELILFILFFMIAFLALKIFAVISETKNDYNKNQQIETKIVSTIDNYIEMNNYEYTYNITLTQNNNITNKTIVGTKYNDQNTFKILQNKYHIENNIIYDVNNNEVNNLNEYDLINLLPINIANTINSIENKTETKYNDGNIKTEYDNNEINLITYENNNYINKIEIDLSRYMNKINSKITYYFIEINYSNINNISSFN